MKERIFYYDALKAFSIFVVIMGHVLFFSLHESNNIIWKFIDVVNMSMFMFVSGFLCGNPSLDGCKKRLRTLLLPTIVVGLIYTYIKGCPIPSFFTNSMHWGYWFCITLFMYYIFYYLTYQLFRLFKLSSATKRCILLWGGVVTLLLISRIIPNNVITQSLSLPSFFRFLPYFIYGVTLNMLPRLKEEIETNNYLYTISFILLIITSYFTLTSTVGRLIVSFSYINVMVYLFNRICKNRKSKTIDYVAKRTLDIYLFHYFMLPAFIVDIPSVFDPNTNILYTLIPVIIISLVVLAGTLVLTKLIELSKILSFLMLGKRINR